MTRHDPREPLDADERELAGRLSRLGADGPSPALDARILAAARAAAAPTRTTTRRRSWLAWASIPPAAITGVGVAAACVLALGVVWQMRPRVAMVPAAAESEDEVFIVADAAPARAPVANPPPFEDAAAGAAADTAAAPQASAQAAAPPAARQARSPVAAAPSRDQAPAELANAAAAPAASPSVEAIAAATRAKAAAAEDAMAREESASQAQAAERKAMAAEQAAAKARRATYTSAARATAEPSRRQESVAAPASAPLPTGSPAPAPYAADPPDASAAELDRIEVTGSRLEGFDPQAFAGLAPSEDRKLQREDWLARIRARRDAGELADAKESLRLFRKAHPRVYLPEDLRKLASDDAP